MAPIVHEIRRRFRTWRCTVVATAQHREMLDHTLRVFGITPDIDLDVMEPGQELAQLTAKLVLRFESVLKEHRPDVVLAQGDTTTTFVAGLCSFYRNIPFGHVEAGLRTGIMRSPFPEEMNRVLSARLARWHFAPTDSARRNLLKEGYDESSVHMTGNTVVDALLATARLSETGIPHHSTRRLMLVTAHRRENFGQRMSQIFAAIRALVERNPDLEVLYPVHPNPQVAGPARAVLGGHERIVLSEPLEYLPFVAALKRCYLVLTDSGGIQEEAPALGKPVLVCRHDTERPEAVEAGVARLVGTETEAIVTAAQELLDNPAVYSRMARGVSPYGDGHAAERIVKILGDALEPGLAAASNG
jgi:UDP-N-acetylglucosamine 2-epimerase (non-hydrolysing)